MIYKVSSRTPVIWKDPRVDGQLSRGGGGGGVGGQEEKQALGNTKMQTHNQVMLLVVSFGLKETGRHLGDIVGGLS